MNLKVVSCAALCAALGAGAAFAAPAPVTGSYVESRSANVFVGACHREGEIQTGGRGAVLAWQVAAGEYQGVDLAGVTAVAVVSGDRHLDLAGATRRSVLYVSDQATAAQRTAFSALLRERAPKALGEVLAVKAAPVRFTAGESNFQVSVAGAAEMKVRKTPGELCCKQPYEVWGSPSVPVAAAKTGFGHNVEYRGGALPAWKLTEQNNSFWGTFSL